MAKIGDSPDLLKNKGSVKEEKSQGSQRSLRKPGERRFEVVPHPESHAEVGCCRSTLTSKVCFCVWLLATRPDLSIPL
jgi:hypothetical protein